MPAARSSKVSAAVPDATPTQCAAPQAAAHADSKRLTSSPRMKPPSRDHPGERRLELGGDGRVLAVEGDEGNRRAHPHDN
jgi:hypothetical protein